MSDIDYTSTKKCYVEGCNKPIKCRGICSTHYARYLRHGDPTKVTRNPSGTGYINDAGYRIISKRGVNKREHILVAEKALGKPLPLGAVVHHVDENTLNNVGNNLVICPDQAYHNFLHVRTNAMRASGNVHFRKCPYCKKYDDTAVMYLVSNTNQYRHRECVNESNLRSYRKRTKR